MRYRVAVDIAGIPGHAWGRSTAAALLSSSCLIDSVDEEAVRRADRGLFSIRGWTSNPGLIPSSRILAIPEADRPDELPATRTERHLLHYDVAFNLTQVERARDAAVHPDVGRASTDAGGSDGHSPEDRAPRRRRRRGGRGQATAEHASGQMNEDVEPDTACSPAGVSPSSR